MLCWVQTSFQQVQGKPNLDVWWPAVKYDSQSLLFKIDPIVQGNELLKKQFFKDNVGILADRNLIRQPVARLLGNPPVTIIWLLCSNMEKNFMDEFYDLRTQFDTLPDTDDRKIRFDEAVLEALSQFKSSSSTNSSVKSSSKNQSSNDGAKGVAFAATEPAVENINEGSIHNNPSLPLPNMPQYKEELESSTEIFTCDNDEIISWTTNKEENIGGGKVNLQEPEIQVGKSQGNSMCSFDIQKVNLQEPEIQVGTSQGNSMCSIDIHSDPSEQKGGANVPSIITFPSTNSSVKSSSKRQSNNDDAKRVAFVATEPGMGQLSLDDKMESDLQFVNINEGSIHNDLSLPPSNIPQYSEHLESSTVIFSCDNDEILSWTTNKEETTSGGKVNLQEPEIQVGTSQGNSMCSIDIHSDPSEQKGGANVPSIITFTRPREMIEEPRGIQNITLAPPHIPKEFQWLTSLKHIWVLNGKSQHLATVASYPFRNEANNKWVLSIKWDAPQYKEEVVLCENCEPSYDPNFRCKRQRITAKVDIDEKPGSAKQRQQSTTKMDVTEKPYHAKQQTRETFVKRLKEVQHLHSCPLILKNANCHICKKRRPTSIRFGCNNPTHIFCEVHTKSLKSSLCEFHDLEEIKSKSNYCPICSLECWCAKCNSQFDRLWNKHGIDLEFLAMDKLDLFAAKCSESDGSKSNEQRSKDAADDSTIETLDLKDNTFSSVEVDKVGEGRGKEEAVCTKQAQGHAKANSSTKAILQDEENESNARVKLFSEEIIIDEDRNKANGLMIPFHVTCNSNLDVIIVDDDSADSVRDTSKNSPAAVEQAGKCKGREEAVCTKQAQGHAKANSSTEVIILDEENESNGTFKLLSEEIIINDDRNKANGLMIPFHVTCNRSLDVIIIDDDSANHVGDTSNNPSTKVEQASKCRGKEKVVCSKQPQGHAKANSSIEVIILDEDNESERFGMKTSFAKATRKHSEEIIIIDDDNADSVRDSSKKSPAKANEDSAHMNQCFVTYCENTDLVKLKCQCKSKALVCQKCLRSILLASEEVQECDYRGHPRNNPKFSLKTKCPWCRQVFSPRTLRRMLPVSFLEEKNNDSESNNYFINK